MDIVVALVEAGCLAVVGFGLDMVWCREWCLCGAWELQRKEEAWLLRRVSQVSVMASERTRSHNLLEIKFAERSLQGSMIPNCRTNKDVFSVSS